jgi:hypothetical protein
MAQTYGTPVIRRSGVGLRFFLALLGFFRISIKGRGYADQRSPQLTDDQSGPLYSPEKHSLSAGPIYAGLTLFPQKRDPDNPIW